MVGGVESMKRRLWKGWVISSDEVPMTQGWGPERAEQVTKERSSGK